MRAAPAFYDKFVRRSSFIAGAARVVEIRRAQGARYGSSRKANGRVEYQVLELSPAALHATSC